MSAPIDVICLATSQAQPIDMKPWRAQRRPVGEYDVEIDMKFCGICHTDVAFAKGEMGLFMKQRYPLCPGHELSGVVASVGSKVTKVRVGDHAGVGTIIDSCLKCGSCKAGAENMCMGTTLTYGSSDRHGRAASPCGYSLGGYTNRFVVHEHFAIKIPKGYPLEAAGPLLCAGITVYDPMRVHRVGPGSKVGIAGLGGLGCIGLTLAKALGATVTAITRSASKAEYARKCGADNVVISSDPASMAAARGTLDLVINTIPGEHDFYIYNTLLNGGGKHVLVGISSGIAGAFIANALSCGSVCVAGSGTGGIAATQELVDFCAAKKIVPNITVVGADEVNSVFEKLDAATNAVGRYAIDLTTLNDASFSACKAPPTKLGQGVATSVARMLWTACGMLCCSRRG